jgi:hypothetical protein
MTLTFNMSLKAEKHRCFVALYLPFDHCNKLEQHYKVFAPTKLKNNVFEVQSGWGSVVTKILKLRGYLIIYTVVRSAILWM